LAKCDKNDTQNGILTDKEAVLTGSPFSLYRRKESGVWYARFRLPDGSWSSARSTRENKKAAAIIWCQEYLHKVGAPPASKKRITFAEFTEGFFDPGGPWERCLNAHSGEITGTHLQNQRGRLKNYLLPVFGTWKLDSITAGDIDKALLHIRETGRPKSGKNKKAVQVTNRTVNSFHSCLSVIFAAAVRQGYMAKNPMPEVPRLREQHKKRGILTVAELSKLIDPLHAAEVWGHERYYLMFLIAVTTAARSGEIRSLHVEDVAGNFLIIRRSLDDQDGERATTKTGITRTIPLSPALQRRLLLYIRNKGAGSEDYIFESPVKAGQPIDRLAILNNFRQALEKIGISRGDQERRNLVYHGLRHAAATIAIAQGVNPWLVRQMTGHKTDKVFQLYIDHSEGADWSSLSEWQERLLEGATSSLKVVQGA
jgi:integrase